MLKAFPMRSCSDSTYKRAEQTGRPCLLGDIGKCAAPCVGRVTKEEHKSIALDFASFMAGNDSSYIGDVARKMKAAAAEQDYEAAARYRDQLAALETALSKSAIVLGDDVDADIFGIAHDELAAAVQQFIVRGGRIRGVRSWVVDKELDVELAELVETVVQNAYDDEVPPPRRVVVPELPEDAASSSCGWARCARRAARSRCGRRATRREGGPRPDRRHQREERAHPLQDPAQRRLRGSVAGPRRHPGGPRHG